jgi:hypothetical protein
LDETTIGNTGRFMKDYSNNLVFVDLLFNLLVGFTSLFIIAFMLINPITKNATIDPPIVFIIECFWNNDSNTDIDLYVQGPDGNIVYYGNKDGSYMVLERDDLGKSNDTFIINDKVVTINRNYEMVTMSQLPPGEYVVNVHYFTKRGEPEPVEVAVTSIVPFKKIINREVILTPNQEVTVISFYVNSQGKVEDVRTDLSIPLRKTR